MKQQWRVLLKGDGHIRLTPHKAARVVIACSVLHNIARRHRDPLPRRRRRRRERDAPDAQDNDRSGVNERTHYINRYY